MAPEFPDIKTLLPQKEPMVLLDEVTASGSDYIECRTRAGASKVPVDELGAVPVWVGLEYMAQTAAAFAGLQAIEFGREIRKGVVLGSRKLECSVNSFCMGQALTVRAEVSADTGDMAVFDCAVRDANSGAELLKGSISVYKPENFDEILIRN